MNASEFEFVSSESLGAPEPIASSAWVVLKFGGSSVSSAANWATIAALIQARLDRGLRPLVVHSALHGVSNTLDATLQLAAEGQESGSLEEIRDQHYQLAAELGVDGSDILAGIFDELEQLIAGARLVREVSTRVRVRVMALGELMATRIGARFLNDSGIRTHWLDARDVLTTSGRGGGRRRQDYLSATCDYQPDAKLQARLNGEDGVVLTQGFIARNAWGETVLLGRGGSDTSAAYFAARLQARRLEIWTDVPGMFSADPRVVPSARLLVALHYDEAQELASAGSAVLHPRCLSPLKRFSIPLFVRCTSDPSSPGTTISAVTDDPEPGVKGICLRNGVSLISLDGVNMWHEVGFLARVFAVFAEHDVSVDLVSTSETNVTVSIDTTDRLLSEDVERDLLADLGRLCNVRSIRDCSALSLVGRKIRTILPRLAPALEVFEEEKIHLMTQAANDLNLSFVVEQGQGPKLVRKLHASIIGRVSAGRSFGPSWEQLFHGDSALEQAEKAWWVPKRRQLMEVANRYESAYVYDLDTVREAASKLLQLESVSRILYAVKANTNPDILRLLASLGVGFECVSRGEVEWLEKALPDAQRALEHVLFTPNFAPREEYEWACTKGLAITLDNLYPLTAWPDTFAGREIFIRIDPGKGRGHHEHVKTAGVLSKFGIPRFELEELRQLVESMDIRVVGLHAHSGSGILDPENWRAVAEDLIEIASAFPHVRWIDLGGGLGIPEKPGEKQLDLCALDQLLGDVKTSHPEYEFWLEPGRYLVAAAGVLLTRVTQIKGKGEMKYLGVGVGMNSLIRPALYGAYHEIVNLSRADEKPTDLTTIVGPICETGDRLGSDRLLPASSEGDVILIANAGAYGRVMSSNYNRREPPPEITLAPEK